jgi:hypothetical protein
MANKKQTMEQVQLGSAHTRTRRVLAHSSPFDSGTMTAGCISSLSEKVLGEAEGW